ncbi:FUSC family protein [Streptomyces sp. NPDC008150]|uniref:FUSC family protein n=1 Tax=Streptomyces sp. NPDC008150 TaxID=3364816 RepID=UPI0036E5756C
MGWFRALRTTARSGFVVERKRLEPLVALRGAAGLAIVIAVTLATLGPAAAAGAAFGAFQAALATFERSWRPRPELALASGVSLALSSFIGYVTVSQRPLFLIVLLLWTFVAGLSWAAGPTIGIIASSNVAIMLVTVTLPTSLGEAAGHAGLMVAGGLVQAALIVLFPVRRWGQHRDALADALAAVADYARRLRYDPVAPFDPEPLMVARQAAALTPRQARNRPAELHGARGLAERVRPVLASLADPAVGVPEDGPERDRVRELLASAGTILDAAARAIRRGEPVVLPGGAIGAFRTPDTGSILTGPPYRAAIRLGRLVLDVLETAGGGTPEPEPMPEPTPPKPQRTPEPSSASGVPEPAVPYAAPRSGEAPDAQVASAVGEAAAAETEAEKEAGADAVAAAVVGAGTAMGAALPVPDLVRAGEAAEEEAAAADAVAGAGTGTGTPSAGGTPAGPPPPVPRGASTPHRNRPGVLGLAPLALRAMRAEVFRDSPVARHAVRLAAVAVVGYVLGTALPLGHGYWAPLASVMIMRPDFSQTYSRAVARFGGTLVGVALATAVVQVVGPGTYVSGGLAVVSAGLMYLLMRTGQFATQACGTAYVVFLLGMGGQQWTQTVPERVLLTLLGGVLAMVAYAVYPAWETPRLRTRLADWLAAQGRYAACVVRHYAEPVGKTAPDVREALLGSRSARVAWHQALEHARDEPVRHRGLSHAAADDAIAQLGRVAMLLEAHLPERDARPTPSAARLAEALRTSTQHGARAVRERRVPAWDAVRDALGDDGGLAAEGVDPVVRDGGRLLLEHLRELSDALDTAVSPVGVDSKGVTRSGS